MIIFLCLFCVFALILIKRYDIMHPIVWVVISYSFIIGMYYCSGLSYVYSVRPIGLFYLFCNLFLFCISVYIGQKSRIRLYVVDNKNSQLVSKGLKRYLAIIGYIGIIIYCFDIIYSNQLWSIDAILGNHSGFITGPLSVLGSLMYPCLLVLWLISCSEIISERKFSWRAILPAVAFLAPMVLIAGRQSLFYMIIASGIIILSQLSQKVPNEKLYNLKKRVRKNKKKTWCLLICGVIIALVYFALIAANRSTYTDKVISSQIEFRASMSEKTYDLCTKYGLISEFLLEFVFYFSHELPYLQVLIDNYRGPYGFGGYQFHYIMRRLAFLGIDVDVVENALADYAYKTNTANHVYRTILGSAICDFGLLGTLVFIIFLGVLSGRAYKKYRKNCNTLSTVRIGMVCACVVFSMEYSPFRETTIAYALIWLYLCNVYERHFGNQRGR